MATSLLTFSPALTNFASKIALFTRYPNIYPYYQRSCLCTATLKANLDKEEGWLVSHQVSIIESKLESTSDLIVGRCVTNV